MSAQVYLIRKDLNILKWIIMRYVQSELKARFNLFRYNFTLINLCPRQHFLIGPIHGRSNIYGSIWIELYASCLLSSHAVPATFWRVSWNCSTCAVYIEHAMYSWQPCSLVILLHSFLSCPALKEIVWKTLLTVCITHTKEISQA